MSCSVQEYKKRKDNDGCDSERGHSRQNKRKKVTSDVLLHIPYPTLR